MRFPHEASICAATRPQCSRHGEEGERPAAINANRSGPVITIGPATEEILLHHIGADGIRTIARLSKAAREAQDRLLDKMRIVNKAKDERELAAELAGTLASLDTSLNNAPLRAQEAHR